MVTVFTLSPSSAAQALKDHGLDALGLTVPYIAPQWGLANPTYDETALTISFAGAPKAPFRGILEYLDSLSAFRAVDGSPLTGAGAVLRLHPQAATRFETLAAGRYAPSGRPQIRSVAHCLVIRGLNVNQSPQTHDPGDDLPSGAAGLRLSFHDARGLIICPIAVAAMLDDLMTTYPALDYSKGATAPTGAGGMRTIAGLASGILAHVVTLHGRAFAAVTGGPGVERQNSGGTSQGAVGDGGLVSMAADDKLAGTGSNAAARLRLGWAAGGEMSADALTIPALAGGTLSRQFVRAFAVDLDWHLLGNRTSQTIASIAGDDGKMPDDLKPKVWDGVTIDHLVDGPDMLGASSQILARLTGAPAGGLLFAVSPTFEANIGSPSAPGTDAHWPAYPAPNSGAGFGPSLAAPEATATWSGSNDVVVSLPAGFAPEGASVRIYPQKFQIIEAIGEEPSFLRGDGGTAIAGADAVHVLLPNPFGLADGDPRPDPGTLVFDLVVTTRAGQRRIWAARSAQIASGTAPAVTDNFSGATGVDALPDIMKSVCPVPLFGLARTVTPASGTPATPLDLALAYVSEGSPRQGPRLPTMARFDTIVASGIPSGNVTEGLEWEAVLSGGRWAKESRSTDHGNANPGNPAGPDVHASGIRVSGGLGYDLAFHSVRRVQPVLPLPGGSTPGWIVMAGGDNFPPPIPSDAAPKGTSAGAVLSTISAICDTPELSLLPDGNPLDSSDPINLQEVVNDIADAMNIPRPTAPDWENEDRLINMIRREYFAAKNGVRDPLWALNRAISEADELIYIETAGFARTARPGTSPAAHEIDLVRKIADRMTANRNLKVIVCTPRDTDFAPRYAPFVRQAIAQRVEALTILQSVDQSRVVAFHPRGFPGRWAQIRTTSVIIDDVWSLTGTTHFRRRGMTFDGSTSISSFDRTIENGYSKKVRDFRRQLMAAKLQITPTDDSGMPVPEWLRLQSPAAAFDLVSDLIRAGGLSKLGPLWYGPTDTTVTPQSDDVADPDGSNGMTSLTFLASMLSDG